MEIGRDGAWCLEGVSTARNASSRRSRRTPSLPGAAWWRGEDGRVQASWRRGRVHTGAGPQTLRSAWTSTDSAGGLQRRCASGEGRICHLRRDPARTGRGDGPALRCGGQKAVKDVIGGSSIGVHRCADDGELACAVDLIVADGGDVLVEAGIVGLETTCGLIGDGAEAHPLPIVEIEPRAGAFFDLEQKYASEGGAVETCPRGISGPSWLDAFRPALCRPGSSGAPVTRGSTSWFPGSPMAGVDGASMRRRSPSCWKPTLFRASHRDRSSSCSGRGWGWFSRALRRTHRTRHRRLTGGIPRGSDSAEDRRLPRDNLVSAASCAVVPGRSGGMVDAADSKSASRKGVRVRVPSPVPTRPSPRFC